MEKSENLMKSRFEDFDPYVVRETEKYGIPIPSREYIQSLLKPRKRPMSAEALIEQMGIHDPDLQIAVTRRLSAMVRDGELLQSAKGFLSEDHVEEIKGFISVRQDTLSILSAEGEFLAYLLTNRYTWLMNGDEIVAHIVRQEGEKVFATLRKVVHYADLTLLGRMIATEEGGVVLSYDRNLHGEVQILKGSKHAKDGEIVQMQIDRLKSRETQVWSGEIVKVLGDRSQAGIEVEMAIQTHQLPHTWSAQIESACEKWKAGTLPRGAAKGRIDLRVYPLVTIDGEDAKDFDDAVFCEERANGGWRLIVAIADVSHYVRPNSPLDKEAQLRGTSVYFPGTVIPMLPEALSNELCSLKPMVDRLCLACDMVISKTGKITHYEFYNAIMHSNARLTYNEVANLLEGNKRLRLKFGPLVGMLQSLNDLYQVLHTSREERGAIAFESVETQFLFDEEGQIANIVPRLRNDAHKIIEECMLCANVAAARLFQKYKMPALYRVHEGPNIDKLTELHRFLGVHGVKMGGGDKPKPLDYNAVLKQIQKRPHYRVIQTMLLRSLTQAIYTPRNKGHFGLAYPAYVHFTSPIRRYPDLMVHRAIKEIVHGEDKSPVVESMTTLDALGEQCSLTERRADEASRDATQALKCRYMMDKVGEEYQGVITSVVPFGLFIELKDIYVEGLVHVTQLGADYFVFDASHQRMMGERTHTIYALGDEVKVRLVKVDLDSNRMDLQLVGVEVRGGDRHQGGRKEEGHGHRSENKRRKQRRRNRG